MYLIPGSILVLAAVVLFFGGEVLRRDDELYTTMWGWGTTILVVGLGLISWGVVRERKRPDMQMISGSILILAATLLFVGAELYGSYHTRTTLRFLASALVLVGVGISGWALLRRVWSNRISP